MITCLKNEYDAIHLHFILLLNYRLRIECENLMEFEQFRREALSILWQHCFYGPIKIFKTLGELEPDEKEWLQSFISQCISHISCLLQKYPESRHSLLIFLGDLYRYAWTYCGKNGRDLSIAEEAYKKVRKKI